MGGDRINKLPLVYPKYCRDDSAWMPTRISTSFGNQWLNLVFSCLYTTSD